MRNFVESIDELRPDLLVITEYHAEWNDVAQEYKIFSPGGKMIEEKFLLDSYYDFLLHTHVEIPEEGRPTYHFVTERDKGYNARCAQLFPEVIIPNDLQRVIDKLREYTGIYQENEVPVGLKSDKV